MASSAKFDDQAGTFDERTGIPPPARHAIARAVVELAADPARTTLLEIGAGTGEIGAELLPLVRSYIAIDASPRMLDRFRCRAPTADLVVADADQRWPIDDASIDLVFGSRSLHLLSVDHLVNEIDRVTRNGACLLVGRVRRDRDNPRERLRRELQHLIAARGFHTRRGDVRTDVLIGALLERGWTHVPAQEVASFRRSWCATDSLAAWAAKPGMADGEREALGIVEAWAKENLGDLDARYESVEGYTLQGCRRASF